MPPQMPGASKLGDSQKAKSLPSLNLHEEAYTLVKNHNLFEGHKPFSKIITARRVQVLQDIVTQHILATSLRYLDPPILLRMIQLCNHNQKLWKEAYNKDFYGLQNLPLWSVINEVTYQKLGPVMGNALPSMAISMITYDQDIFPKRVKWRIVALGNLDPHEWSSEEVFAPVMTMLELRVLVSLVMHHKQHLKSGDVKQAF
eukprot:7206185-Ditylum_brightwellii.AAC.1